MKKIDFLDRYFLPEFSGMLPAMRPFDIKQNNWQNHLDEVAQFFCVF